MLSLVMLRTTVMLPPEIKARAEAMARESGVSFAEFVRRALEGEIGKGAPNPDSLRRSRDPLFQGFDELIARAKPGEPGGAADHDRYIHGR